MGHGKDKIIRKKIGTILVFSSKAKEIPTSHDLRNITEQGN